jgi:hypothetical protein
MRREIDRQQGRAHHLRLPCFSKTLFFVLESWLWSRLFDMDAYSKKRKRDGLSELVKAW